MLRQPTESRPQSSFCGRAQFKVLHSIERCASDPGGSDLDLTTEFDHSVGGDAEEFRRIQHGVGHEDEELLAPAPEAGALTGNDLFAADEEGRLEQIEMELHEAAL